MQWSHDRKRTDKDGDGRDALRGTEQPHPGRVQAPQRAHDGLAVAQRVRQRHERRQGRASPARRVLRRRRDRFGHHGLHVFVNERRVQSDVDVTPSVTQLTLIPT